MSPFDFSYRIQIDGRDIPLWRAKLVYGFARLVGVRVSIYTRVHYVGTPVLDGNGKHTGEYIISESACDE